MTCNKRWVVSWLCLLAAPALAQAGQVEEFNLSTGTGFFVNDDGYLLTNDHVTAPCSQYTVYGNNHTMQAVLVASDKGNDLALLRAATATAQAGRFRSFTPPLQIGDTLTVVGYPGAAWKKNAAVARSAELLALTGPQGEEGLLQFSDAIRLGNSGGPLFDKSGAVVGVVVAKSILTRVNTLTNTVLSVKHVDVAIGQKIVRDFLTKNGVTYYLADSEAPLTKEQIAIRARHTVVNIRCRVDGRK